MNRIILINGTYGVGKTTIAKSIMNNNDENFVLLDPDEDYNELVEKGMLYMLGWPMQTSKVYLRNFRQKVEIAVKEKNVIIPMTISTDICRREVYDYLIKNTDTIHVILSADEKVIVDRINKDVGRSKNFSKDSIKNNILYLKNNFIGSIWIDTSSKSIDSVANEIILLIQQWK